MPDNIQKDLVLDPCSYAFLKDNTKGYVSCWVGPCKTSLSQSDCLVVFNEQTKKFEECSYERAIQRFVTIPEGWYCALKNPAPDNKHPTPGTSNSIPDNMAIGQKVNVRGPANFALYPGQMAQVIRGHSLRSNQYLIAKVYDADTLNKDKVFTEELPPYFNGQTLVIKGTEVSFYIPPTGIEVKAVNNNPNNGYIRSAVTLERLEYCILKDEDGSLRYAYGPQVVFPEPTEAFVEDDTGNIKRKAIELSDISGVYVKVVAKYTEDGKTHKVGEEMFITGKDQMIYYPRPEHTFITYGNQVIHHAIAIPSGEGRYIMNRLTGEIKTVRGPAMYLPDPRVEVVVKRTLSRPQCEMWYPGNDEALIANGYIPFVTTDVSMDDRRNYTYLTTTQAITTGADNINRQNTYTPPRTISLDSSKYAGAVSIDVWTGYAVNVISKDGTRKIVQGPQTVLLDYDQTLEVLELSTGKPKTTDKLEKVTFLRHENNRVSDIINVESSDFISASIKVSYLVNFDPTKQDKWFSVDNYIKHLCDWARAAVKRYSRNYSIMELRESYTEIVADALKEDSGNENCLHYFEENGMMLTDVEVLSIDIEKTIQNMFDEHRENLVASKLTLEAAILKADQDKEKVKLNEEKAKLEQEYQRIIEEECDKTKRLSNAMEFNRQKMVDEENRRRETVKVEIQTLKDQIFQAEQAREKQKHDAELAYKKHITDIEAERETKAAENMRVVFEALGPDIAASMKNHDNKDIIKAMAEAISPYAIANNEGVSDAITRILRGSHLEEVLKNFNK